MPKSLRLGVVLCIPLAFADNYPRQPGIDAQHYTFRIALTDADDEVAGEATVDLRFLQSGVTRVVLDLTSLKDGKGMTVTACPSHGAALPFQHSADRLAITLDSAPAAGERRRVHRQIPRRPGRRPAHRQEQIRRPHLLQLELAHPGAPVAAHDRPPLRQGHQRIPGHRAAKYQVVANGLLQEELDLGDGRRMTHWKQSVPIASWLNNIGVAQFASRHFAHRRRRAAANLGLPAGSRKRHRHVRRAHAPGHRVLRVAHRPVPL